MQQRKYFMKIFLVLALFSISYTVTSLYVLYSQNSTVLPAFFYAKNTVPEYLVCSQSRSKDNLLTLIDATPKPVHSIFFHETTCQAGLRLREACSVESAARSHTDRQIYVIFSKSLSISECTNGVLADLATLPNVNYHRMDLNAHTQYTPINKIPIPRVVSLGNWNVAKAREVIKILTLYKFGGVVIDLDVMVVGSLGPLGDAWVSRKGDSFQSTIISVSRGLSGRYYGQHFFNTLKHHIALDFGQSMESSVKQALMSLCNTTSIHEMTRENCKGFHVYSSEFFHAGNQSWVDLKPTNDTYLGYYLWDDGNHTATMPKDSLYGVLAKQYCPMVYSKFMAVGDMDVIQL